MILHIQSPIYDKNNRNNLSRLVGSYTANISEERGWIHIHADERGGVLYLFRDIQEEEMTLQLCFLKDGKIRFTVINNEPLGERYDENELHKHCMKFDCFDRAFNVFLAEWSQTE